ncbi:glucose 1-dehydrogenase [Pusillimonas sp. DMV24BSW_D]|uniref:SDR family NAD(P)-dependent oxidoreductase n=1 Tax=Neopusillimonas aestuarii TaxID=2716226 RepID=UPI00140B3952|nr:glucose 1-dehydrogenase [Pusillimonas sp. DMV24BSW_D]QIM48726.1 glucose 1-dehydrogenase [Pusillimonas sp. DMV24BSW_D]
MSEPFNPGLKGKTVIVTGGAAGIGKSMSEGFYQRGANVVIADLKDAVSAAKSIDPTEQKVRGVEVDVRSEASIQAAIAQTLSCFERIDVLVNNAGIATGIPPRPFHEIDPEEWKNVYDVNVIGIFRSCRAVVPFMEKNGGGRIINIASAAAFKGVPYLLHYVSSKGAVLAMTKSLAKELGEKNILVNAVAPGFTLSESVLSNEGQMTRSKGISLQGRAIAREQYPADVVGAVLFFASNDAAFITGQTLVVDGGTYLH